MGIILTKVIFLYLLLPIIGIILGFVLVLIAKKNKLLQNKKVIFFFLISCIVLAIPGLSGFSNFHFVPYGYLSLQVVYLILGYIELRLLYLFVPEIKKKDYYLEFLFIFIIMFVGAALFSLVFNLTNELQYGLTAATCAIPFIIPSLFWKMYTIYLAIPPEVYKTWSFNENSSSSDVNFDRNKVIVVKLELLKQVNDNQIFTIQAKASSNMIFSNWFNIFIKDYNFKSPMSAIAYKEQDTPFEWIFYTVSLIGRRKYIDPDLTFEKNKINDKMNIIAKRVVQNNLSNLES